MPHRRSATTAFVRKDRAFAFISLVVRIVAIITILSSLASLAQVETKTAQAPREAGNSQGVLVSVSGNNAQKNGGQKNGGQKTKSSLAPASVGSPDFLSAVLYDSGGSDVLQTNGGQFQGIAVADFNGDGKPDVVVSNFAGPDGSGNGVLGVLWGNGDGTFQPAVTFGSSGYGANSVAAADVNGDGVPDVVVANMCESASNCSTGNVAVLLGNGDGTLQPAVTYSSGGRTALSIAVADVNGDGIPDLLVANEGPTNRPDGGSGSVGVLLGKGNGTFHPAVMYSTGMDTSSLSVADLNGDGKPDVVVTTTGTPSVNVLLNNGDGTFQAPVSYATDGFIPTSVAIADVNEDGKPDLVVANWYSGTLSVLLGNGDGTFQAAVTYSSGGASPDSVVIVDVNGDDIPDLVVANCGSSQNGYGCSRTDGVVSVLLGNGDGTFQPAVTFSSGAFNEISVAAADVNGDGKPDLLVVDQGGGTNGDGSVGVLLNNTDASSKPTTATVVSALNPSTFGQSTTLTAAVSSPEGTPTGTVLFFDGSRFLGSSTLAHRSASLSMALLAAGSHSIAAAYQGSKSFAPNTSAALNQLVQAATTTIAVMASANPASVKQNVNYTATVTSEYGGPTTGTVTFSDGGATIATVSLADNQVVHPTLYLTAGAHAITATYFGDANNAASVSSTLTEEIGNPAFSSKTVLTTSGSPSLVEQPVTFTATLTSNGGPIPDGKMVTFYADGEAIGRGFTSGGVTSFATSSLTARTHVIKAAYAGDNEFKASSGAVTEVVDKYATTTALASSLNPADYGQKITYTATVASSGSITPTGSVRISGIGLVPLIGGAATITEKLVAVGTRAVTAEYLGDGASAQSTSAVLEEVVNQASTTTVLASSANPSTSGQKVTFTATVTSATGSAPSSTITFAIGGTTLRTVAVTDTKASFSTATLPAGSTTITATYNGAAGFSGSSTSLTQTVQP